MEHGFDIAFYAIASLAWCGGTSVLIFGVFISVMVTTTSSTLVAAHQMRRAQTQRLGTTEQQRLAEADAMVADIAQVNSHAGATARQVRNAMFDVLQLRSNGEATGQPDGTLDSYTALVAEQMQALVDLRDAVRAERAGHMERAVRAAKARSSTRTKAVLQRANDAVDRARAVSEVTLLNSHSADRRH